MRWRGGVPEVTPGQPHCGYFIRRTYLTLPHATLMTDVLYPFIYWPVGIALGGWLFFEIARRM
jgi:hypothetical protein